MAIGKRSRGRRSRGGNGAPRQTRSELAGPASRTRILWISSGALIVAGAIAVFALGRGVIRSNEERRVERERVAVTRSITDAVTAALDPLGAAPAPRFLSAPADLADALEASQDPLSVGRAAAIGEALVPLLGTARDAITEIDVVSEVRDRGLDEPSVARLIDARARIIDALDLYLAAARLAAQTPLIDGPTLASVLETARGLVDRAAALFSEGHDRLVEAQIAAGLYSGPLIPNGGFG